MCECENTQVEMGSSGNKKSCFPISTFFIFTFPHPTLFLIPEEHRQDVGYRIRYVHPSAGVRHQQFYRMILSVLIFQQSLAADATGCHRVRGREQGGHRYPDNSNTRISGAGIEQGRPFQHRCRPEKAFSWLLPQMISPLASSMAQPTW